MREGAHVGITPFQKDKRTLPHGRVSALLRAAVEDGVDDVEGDHAGSDHCASGDRAPKNIAPGKLPNREQASNYRHQDASARRPERNRPDHIGIQEAPSNLVPFEFLHIILL